MEPALSAVEGSAVRCLRSGRVCGASDPLFPFLECGGGLRAIGARRETRRRFPASTMSSRAQRVVCAPDVFAERAIRCFPFWSAAAGSGPWVPGEKLDAAFPPLRCHPERSALFALRTCLRSERSAVSLFGVRRRAPGHRCPARNSTPLSRLYDVIPSAARCLRSGRVCGASDPLFPFLECGGGLRAMGARRETRRRFPASTMSSRAQRVVCAPDVFAERGICCFPFWSAAAGSGPWVPGEKLDAAFPPLRCHPERSALFALRTCLRSERSAVSLFGVRRRAPGHGCPARNSTPLSRLYDVIPSAARCLRSGRVCGARDLLFPSWSAAAGSGP